MAPKRFGYGFQGFNPGPLALTLLMLRIGADDHHAAFALDDFALLANGFHGRFYLHDVNLLYNTRRLFRTPGDPGFGQVVGRHFHGDLVAGQDADEVGPQLAGNCLLYTSPANCGPILSASCLAIKSPWRCPPTT